MKKFNLDNRIKYLINSYLITLLVFTLFRLVLVVLNLGKINEIISIEKGISLILQSLVFGFRFDSLVICFSLSVFIMLFLIAYFSNIKSKLFYKINHYLIIILFSILFSISSIDIPYFQYFFSRFTLRGFLWIDSFDFVIKMIFQEWSFIIYFILFILIIIGFVWIMNRNYKSNLLKLETKNKISVLNIFSFLIIIGLCFIGMRGRLEIKSPLRIGTAYFSNYPLLNQIGLNPNYTLAKSIEEANELKKKGLSLIDNNTAKQFVEDEFKSFLNKDIVFKSPKKLNVVLVIMESMSAEYMGYFTGESSLTPNLDKIAKESISFTNSYTAGIHTYNGVYSTLFSLPALLDIHSMKTTQIPELNGLPNILKSNGYNTLYFTTHDDQFDNIGGFLKANSVDKIISVSDYPKSQIKSTLGVSDHIMFDKAIQTINSIDKSKPFFASLLTSSFHNPYVYPENIDLKTKSKDIKYKMLEYSDWAIGRFIEKAKECTWFENTVFVFIADHGAYIGNNPYPIPLAYHHTPFLIYSPSNLSPKEIDNHCLQIDLSPTILSLLNLNYTHNNLGVDIINNTRRYAYFSSDDRIGVLDDKYLYIWDKNSNEYLYLYKKKDTKNYIKEEREKANDMKKYAFSMIQYTYDNFHLKK